MIINGYYWTKDGNLLSERELAEMDPKPEPIKVVWVNAYRISRHYGGPEEGGWWYDWHTCIASMPISVSDDIEEHVDKIKAMMKEALGWEPDAYEAQHGGSRFTVNGHSDFAVYLESSYQESETTEGQHYE